MTPRYCRNRECGVLLHGRQLLLCPSCAFIGKVGFFIGAVLAGAVGYLLKVSL